MSKRGHEFVFRSILYCTVHLNLSETKLKLASIQTFKLTLCTHIYCNNKSVEFRLRNYLNYTLGNVKH
jgi:hypothetical protein